MTYIPRITIDFETRSKVDIKKSGAYRYAMDDSTSVLCLAYKIPGDPLRVWNPWVENEPSALFKALSLSDFPLEAHNAEFEYCVWKYHCIPKLNWPELNREILYCSAAKAAALSLPRKLERLAKALEVEHQKDMSGHRLMLKHSKPRKPTKHDKNVWWQDIEEHERIMSYCADDVLTEEACSNTLPDLSKRERALYLLDQKINERGIYCDLDNVEIALSFAEKYNKELSLKLKEITGGRVSTVNQVSKLLDFVNDGPYSLDNLRKDTLEELLERHSEDNNPYIEALKIRLSLAKSSVKKLKSMKTMACPDGRIRGTLLYHGASTGRWSGRGIQPQNFIKGSDKDFETIFHFLEQNDYDFFRDLYPDVLDALASTLRGMLCAAPGYELFAVDYSAIEARVVLWLAGDEEALDIFRRGEDIYKDMAKDIYKCGIDSVDALKRALGKVAILGLGYGMGWKKFVATCKQWGITITDDLSKHTVETYRTNYWKVVGLWKAVEDCAMRAVQSKGRKFKVGKISYKCEGDFLLCYLPSGRTITYYDPKIETVQKAWGAVQNITFMGTDATTKQWVRQGTYGGKLVENISQAVARDVMADAMMRVEKAGFPVIMTVHDEIICEVKKDTKKLEDFEHLMSITQPWAEGLPIAVEGWKGKRYRK